MQKEVYKDEQCYEASEVKNTLRGELTIMTKPETNSDHYAITRWKRITAGTVQLLFCN
jgi:hypothetical protein